jgi:hypothetical protein
MILDGEHLDQTLRIFGRFALTKYLGREEFHSL